MKETTKVSVIIPCYNHGQFIDEAVESVLVSTYPHVEIIIVDDGSTDDLTCNTLKNYNKPKTTVRFQENKGVPAARNAAITAAQGRYILPLDADDKIHPQYIEKALQVFERRPDMGIVYCKAEFFGARTGPWDLPSYKRKDFLYQNCIFASAFYKKSDWEKVGGYKNEMMEGLEDWEFFISLIENGARVYQIQEILFYYRQLENSRNTRLERNTVINLHKKILRLHIGLYILNISSAYNMFKFIYEAELKK